MPAPTDDRHTQLHVETQLIAGGRPPATPDGPLNEPITPASALHPGEVGYARGEAPAWHALEQVIGQLEGGEAVTFASGMAAASAAFTLFAPRPTIVAPSVSYQHVRASLQQLQDTGRAELRLVDVTDADAVIAACEGADALWLESPTNPLLGIADLPTLCAFAREREILCVVDNTLATPLGQRPLELGAHVVMHSATKAMGGHSDLLLGAAVTREPELLDGLRHARSHGGATPGSLEVFLCLRGLRTLALRYGRAQENAGVLAQRLSTHPEVSEVRYPGLPGDPGYDRARAVMDSPGFMLTFSVTGGAARADALLERLRVLRHATSLGGVETLIERRARYPIEQGIVPGNLLRVSVGCEHADDLWDDLAQALAATAA
ncbi:MAG TPA: aminotransferase class I/II-fold pyridoxal phosphate-dependent enzyme [Solirubrobacteraceae bacterium]|nr:aminotransferase class I/II-fold pyridoxal phosphate-dependent enzyme [Solirubrobacteraceae bacterium]